MEKGYEITLLWWYTCRRYLTIFHTMYISWKKDIGQTSIEIESGYGMGSSYKIIPQSTKSPNFAQNLRMKRGERLFFMCTTQIKPLENGDYKSVQKTRSLSPNNVSYKPKKQEFWITERKGVLRTFSIYITLSHRLSVICSILCHFIGQ